MYVCMYVFLCVCRPMYVLIEIITRVSLGIGSIMYWE